MSYSTEETIEPFWAEYSSEKSGRDPLAIQYSSVIIYSKMIVGITNVTNRIRFNGFYCWLFDTIAQNISKNNSLAEQIRFTRRAELLLAFIMVKNFPGITGVSGSDFAGKNINFNMSLKDGADWESKKVEGNKVYWQTQSGIFGQYYAAVVRELNLINHPNSQVGLNIYTLSEKGHELAKAYSQNINKIERELFWHCTFNGEVHEDQLIKLQSFALHFIPQNSEERKFYENMLMSQDDRKIEPTFNRRNTIKLLLNYLNNQKDGVENLSTAFLRENYSTHFSLKDLTYDTATSWYLFEINEILHVAFEHFHASFLYSLKTYPTLLDDNIFSLIEETKKAFTTDEINITSLSLEGLSKLLNKKKNNIYDYYEAMTIAFRKRNLGETLKYAIYTILSTYLNSKHHISSLATYAALPENNFNRSGFAIELIDELVVTKLKLTIPDYVKSVLLTAINLHMFSSYTKSQIGQSLVHNYMIEDKKVWRLRETLPNRTTPRLQNAIQFITDIGWLTKEGKKLSITDSGSKIINI
jgi:hypothetical protein